MAPPQLAGHTPVPQVLHPVEVVLLPPLRDEPSPSVADCVDGGPDQVFDGDEPLVRQHRLHDGAAAGAMTHRVVVIVDPDEMALRLQLVTEGLAGFVAIHAEEVRAGLRDPRLRVDDGDGVEAVPLPDLEVEGVVRRRDLHGAGAELGIDGVVGDDGNLPFDNGHPDVATDGGSVAVVVGVDRHRRVAEHRFDACRGDDDPVRAVRTGPVDERVFDVDQLPGFVLVLDLDLRDGGVTTRAPIDDAVPAIDEALLVQGDEHLAHRSGQPVVEREPLPGPIRGEPEGANLLGDASPGAFLPGPHLLDEPFPTEVVPGQALGGEFAFHDVLGGDAGVIGAGHPERGVALHAFAADEEVLDGQVEGVAHVQHAGDVRWRNDDGEGFAVRVDLRPKGPGGLPSRIPTRLDLGGLVRRSHRFLGSCGLPQGPA